MWFRCLVEILLVLAARALSSQQHQVALQQPVHAAHLPVYLSAAGLQPVSEHEKEAAGARFEAELQPVSDHGKEAAGARFEAGLQPVSEHEKDAAGARFEAAAGSEAARMDPVSAAMMGLKLFGMAAKAGASLLMAKVTADIEMQSKQLEAVNKEMKDSLDAIQHMIDQATGEAQTRMFDAVTQSARALIEAGPEAQVASIYKTATRGTGTDTAVAAQREALRKMLQDEYDVLLGLNGQTPERNANARNCAILLRTMAPTLADLQEIMVPETEASIEKRTMHVSQQIEAKTPGAAPELTHMAITAASDSLHAAIRSLKKKHAVTAENALAGGRQDTATVGKQAGEATDLAAALQAEDKENFNNLAGELTSDIQGNALSFGEDMGYGETVVGQGNFFSSTSLLESGSTIGELTQGLESAVAIIDFGKNMLAVYEIMKRGDQQFMVRRNVAVAREAMKSATAEALVSACRLLHLLYDSLRAFSSMDAAKVPDMAWEKLLAADKMIEGLPKKELGQLRTVIHSLMCDAFNPLRKRLGSLFRHSSNGRCATTSMYYKHEDEDRLRAKLTASIAGGATAATDASTTSSVLDCHPLDIMDLVLSSNARTDIDYLTGWNYTLVNSPTWKNGELNAVDVTVGTARSLAGSRVFYTLTCEALRRNMATDPKLLDKYPYAALPVTDVKLVVRPASETTVKQIGAKGSTATLTREEKDLLKSGYSRVSMEFVGGPKKPNSVTISKIGKKFTQAASWALRWWNGQTVTFAHDDPADLKVDQSDKYPAIFAYARRGGPTPLVGLTLVPYATPEFVKKSLSETTLMKADFRAEWNKQPLPAPITLPSGKVQELTRQEPPVGEVLSFKQPDIAMPSFRVECADEVAFKDCKYVDASCTSTLTVKLAGFKEEREAGLSNQLQRMVVHRSLAARGGIKTDELEYGFKFNCGGMISGSPYRWQRIPQALYEGDDGYLAQPYLWQLKRFVVVPLPDTDHPIPPCPDTCELRQHNPLMRAALLDGADPALAKDSSKDAAAGNENKDPGGKDSGNARGKKKGNGRDTKKGGGGNNIFRDVALSERAAEAEAEAGLHPQPQQEQGRVARAAGSVAALDAAEALQTRRIEEDRAALRALRRPQQ